MPALRCLKTRDGRTSEHFCASPPLIVIFNLLAGIGTIMFFHMRN